MTKKYDYFKLRKNSTIVDIYENEYSNPVASIPIEDLIEVFGYKKD